MQLKIIKMIALKIVKVNIVGVKCVDITLYYQDKI